MTDAALPMLLFEQHGLVTRAQVLASGATDSAIHHRVRLGGPWRRVLPGVYLTSNGALTLDQRLMAAQLYAGTPSIIAGAAALAPYRLRGAPITKVDVLVPTE